LFAEAALYIGVIAEPKNDAQHRSDRVTWLLFMDESGHDHRGVPLEVRGGVAIHISKFWGFIQGWQRLERDSFGVLLAEFRSEAKGIKLLSKDRFRWAAQTGPMDGEERRRHARGFLNKGLNHATPTSSEFAAYGQACLEMARAFLTCLARSTPNCSHAR
jgi:hypothetical protein